MKKHLARLICAVAIVATCAILTPAPAPAADGVPCTLTLTFPGGASNIGSNTTYLTGSSYTYYTKGITADARSSLRPLAYAYAVGASTDWTNATLKLYQSATGPAWATVSFTATTSTNVSFETNNWNWLRAQRIYAVLSCTNAGTVVIQGLEQ
jgi:hypothetical protein